LAHKLPGQANPEMPRMTIKHKSVLSSAPLIGGLVLIATSLRAPVTGVAPILATIESAFALSPAQAGFRSHPVKAAA